MKRNYFEPEMKVAAFSSEDVVTTSGVSGTGSNETAYTSAAAGTKASVDFNNVISFSN